jgi:hypothetical protein
MDAYLRTLCEAASQRHAEAEQLLTIPLHDRFDVDFGDQPPVASFYELMDTLTKEMPAIIASISEETRVYCTQRSSELRALMKDIETRYKETCTTFTRLLLYEFLGEQSE